jgi:hypothetical protein
MGMENGRWKNEEEKREMVDKLKRKIFPFSIL